MNKSSLSEVQLPSILIAEDDEDLREEIARRFVREGFCTYTAADGREAYTKFLLHKPDIIITDLRMPHLGGEEIVAYFSKFESNPPLIIVISGDMARLGEWRQHVAGVFEKPFKIEDVIALVRAKFPAQSR